MVFLALPTISRIKRNKIIENLNKFELIVKPAKYIEIVDGRITISNIKDLNINDLLNRESKPDMKLINKNVNQRQSL